MRKTARDGWVVLDSCKDELLPVSDVAMVEEYRKSVLLGIIFIKDDSQEVLSEIVENLKKER